MSITHLPPGQDGDPTDGPHASIVDLRAHQRMLLDGTRLAAFAAAFAALLEPGQHVVEIGAGTGVLSAMIQGRTGGPTTAIEYFEDVARLARRCLHRDGSDRVELRVGRSFDVSVGGAPRVLVTETIGTAGPEENIVQIAHDFRRRHPSIETIVPSHLRVLAQPIAIDEDVDGTGALRPRWDALRRLAPGLDPAPLDDLLASRPCPDLLVGDLSDAEPVGSPVLLADYEMGVHADPSFRTWVPWPPGGRANALHVYFDAELAPGIRLRSDLGSPPTHWKHVHWLAPSAHVTGADLSYTPSAPDLHLRWNR